jgi:predicted PurR-regulated permease PerM
MSRAGSSEFPRLQPLLLLAVVVLILYFARELLIPLAFALTLAFLLAPAVTRLEALRAPRVVAVTLTGILAFAAVFGVGYVVTRQLMSVARNLPAYRLNIQKRIAAVHSPAEQSLETALIAVEGIGEDLTISARPQPAKSSDPLLQFPAEQAQPVRLVDPTRSQLQSNAELLFRVLRPIGTLGVIIVFTIYLLMKREDLRHRILLLAGMGRISVMTQALQDAATRISQYLVMQATVNAAYGILFGSGLYLIGVPDATLWGALAGILRIVPYVGTATGLVLPLVVSIAIFSSWWHPLLIVALFLTLELSATNFVEPWLYSSRTGISSLALLTMAIFWALLWGWPGLILSTPLTVCIVVLGRYVPQMSFLHTLLGTDAELSPEAHFYERLLALDQHEARVVANKFLCGKPLVELYDEVFIPALRLVEQDRHQGTLDETRCNFFFLSIGELIAELTDYRQIDPLALSPNQNPAVRPTNPSAPQSALSSLRGQDFRTWGTTDPTLSHNLSPEALQAKLLAPAQNDFAIICISASDQADELTSHMLAQLMERAGHPTLLLSAASVSSEVLDGLAKEPNTVIFISALPPFAFSQARATCQRVRSHLPQNRIVIGFWEATDDPGQISSLMPGLTADQPSDHMIERFGTGRPTLVVNTLAQALNQIQQWHQQPSTQPVLQ